MSSKPRRVWGLAIVAGLVVLFGLSRRGGAGVEALVGRWVCKAQFLTTTVVFLPDGRYFTVMDTGGTKLHERGQFKLEPGTLTLQSQRGERAQFRIEFAGGRMVLASPAGTADVYLREEGSETAILDEARKADAAKREEDIAWVRRFPIGPARPLPDLALGPVPRDPNAGRVFENAIAFTEMQTYLRYWRPDVTFQVLQGEDPGGGKAQTQLYFLPNGRLFYRNIAYEGVTTEGGAPRAGRVNVTTAWSRYTIQAGPEGGPDALAVESDAGERLSIQLIDGRRNLSWAGTLYGNVVWERHALEQRTQQ